MTEVIQCDGFVVTVDEPVDEVGWTITATDPDDNTLLQFTAQTAADAARLRDNLAASDLSDLE